MADEKEVKVKESKQSVRENVSEDAPAVTAPVVDEDAIRQAGIKVENERQVEIRKSCRSVGLSEDYADKLCADSGIDADQARQAIIIEREQQDRKSAISISAYGSDHNPVDNAQRGLENALLHRAVPKEVELTENGRRFLNGHHTVATMCATYLTEVKAEQGVNYFQMRPDLVITKALTTSDFPLTLANTLNKKLKMDFARSAQTYESIVHRTNLKSFQTHDRIRNEADFKLENTSRSKTPERGKAKYGTIREELEQITLETYEAELMLSRRALINDDLGAFDRISRMAALGIRETEARLVYKENILDNKALVSDSTALFDSSAHNNDTTSNALSAAGSVNAVSKKMMEQQDLSSNFIAIEPNILLVPPALKKDAIEHTSLINQLNTSADIARTIIAKDLVLVVEPRIGAAATGGSDTIWYLISTQDPGMLIELASLEDPTGLTTAISVERVTNEGITYAILHDSAAVPMDFRAMARSAA